MTVIKNTVKFLGFPFLFGIGFLFYLISKKTTSFGYMSFRYLFVLTNGKINDFHSKLIGLTSKKEKKSASGILGDLSEKDIDQIVGKIRDNGFYEFDVTLNDTLLNSMVDFANTTPTRCIDVSKSGVVYLEKKIVFDESAPIGPRYQFDQSDVINNESVRTVIFDPTFRVIASNYLGCQPILDIVTMWWSVPFANKGTAQAAQMYHFDMDRFKFLKFFFYLKDVHTDNGPHCYIRGSHKSIPMNIRKDRRIDDSELNTYYSPEDIKEFIGKKGTILAVDTRGLHKGKPLVSDHRLLFQIQFSNSLFGAPYSSFTINDLTHEETATVKNNKRTYQLIQGNR